jgi:hypothetical protein
MANKSNEAEQKLMASLYPCPEQIDNYKILEASGIPFRARWSGSTLCFDICNPATGEPVITLTTDYENNVFPQRNWSLFKRKIG